jgi:S1-C subfamily serine protease
LHSFKVLGREETLGLVLLEVDDLPASVKPIAGWSPARPLIADSPVAALGLASGAREVLRLPGVVDAPAAATGQDLILTDIKLDPLVEGGALVTPDGKLAGILTAKSKSPELGELGWAVTSEAAKAFVGSLEEKQQAQAAEDIRKVIRRWVVWGILLLIAGLFGLFGWWFRRWYKRMEARELAEEAARAGVTGEDGPITDRAPPVVTPAEDAAEDLGE